MIGKFNSHMNFGIIDYFTLGMTFEEVVAKLIRDVDYFPWYSMTDAVKSIEKLCENHKYVVETMTREQNEPPHTIRYFAVPNYNSVGFDLCAAAKIENNGCTYLFATEPRILMRLNGNQANITVTSQPDWY